MFHAKEDAFQQSTRQRKQARIGLNARPLKGINLPSPSLLLRRLELELQRFEHERGDRQSDCIHAESTYLQNHVHIGIDVIPQLQSFCPDAKAMVPLYEYPALCMHNGQMATSEQLKLCEKTTPLACLMCFPEHNTSSLFLKHHYIKTILESSDALISPSKFLIDRYRGCGIDHPKFLMIENGLPSHFDLKQRDSYLYIYSEDLNHFGYFGQLNTYKRCILLLKAVSLLQKQGITNFTVNIYGANLENQPTEFQDEFRQFHPKVSDRVSLRGSYKQQELETLMLENDWVVVPSIGWEISPVVIQEAFFYGRPVIGSNIGGTIEKIDNRGGFTFTTRSETSLAAAIMRATGNKSLHQALVTHIPSPETACMCIDRHIGEYHNITSQ